MFIKLDMYKRIQHYLIGLFLLSLMTSMAGIEFFSALISLTLLFVYAQHKISQDGLGEISFPSRIGLDGTILFLITAATISLVIHNDYNPNRIHEFTPLRWVILLYTLVFAFQFVGIKKEELWMERFFLVSMAIGLYAFFQANTGIDLVRGNNSAVQFDHFDKFPYFRASGFFSNPMTYGHSSAMWGPLAFSFFLVFSREKKWLILSGLSLLCILIGLYSCHTRGSWIAVFFGLLSVALLWRVKWGLIFLVVALLGGAILGLLIPAFSERVVSIFDPNFNSNVSRMYIWKAHFAIFKDYPWFGSGMNYNPYLVDDYFNKLGVPSTYHQVGHAHNTYLQWLAGTGIIGFLAYMSFITGALLLSLKEYFITEINQKFLRALLLGSVGGQLAFHFGGLTECNFRDAEVKSFFLMLIALALAIRFQRARQEAK